MTRGLKALVCACVISMTSSTAWACSGEGVVMGAAQAYARAARAGSGSAFISAASRYSDLRSISLFALGKHRKNLTKAQEARYVSAARSYMGRFMASNARGIGGGDVKIISCKPGAVVASMGGSRVTFRLSGSRVSDVSISGISLTHALRSNFVGVLNRNNGDVNALITYLR